jgi:hypothetical protein
MELVVARWNLFAGGRDAGLKCYLGHALIVPVIWAVSDVLNAYPDWLGDAWFQVIDVIDLAEMFERASANRRIALRAALSQ